MKSVRKTVIITAASLLGALLLYVIAGSALTVHSLLNPDDIQRNRADIFKVLDKWAPGTKEWAIENMEEGRLKDTTLILPDGARMHCYYMAAEGGSAKTAILVHGYTSNPFEMISYMQMFRDSLGFNVFVPALRGHEQSDGNIQLGWKDRLDIEQVIPVAHEIFQDTLQVLHGVSMGGATVMMCSGDPLPEYVRAIIEDSGYTRVREEVHYLRSDPTFLIVDGAGLLCKLIYGWGFREASSVSQLHKCKLPMLFIHGDADNFVPTDMAYENYDAKTIGTRRIWIVPGATHAQSYNTAPATYTATVRDFLSQSLFPNGN